MTARKAARPPRALIVASRYNEAVTRRLAGGAADALSAGGFGTGHVDTVWVAGAWELPLVLDRGIATDRYALAVAVGAIVRGETPHFDVLAAEVTRQLGIVSLSYGIPVGFALLTCDTLEQALARAGGTHGNKGTEAAEAALESLRMLRRLAADAAS
ncbi:MAG TPA: 6,7-dimethyl-8-ribityllumazine synthase [Gemmatimonadales bacterium]